MMAGDPKLMAAETAYFELLGTVTTFDLTPEKLTLKAGAQEVLGYVPADQAGSSTDVQGAAGGEDINALAGTLVGMSAADAETATTDAGFTFRVTSVDGEPKPVTMDYREDRINAEVEDDKVVTGHDRLTPPRSADWRDRAAIPTRRPDMDPRPDTPDRPSPMLRTLPHAPPSQRSRTGTRQSSPGRRRRRRDAATRTVGRGERLRASAAESVPRGDGATRQPAARTRSWAHREAQAYRRRRREYVAATTRSSPGCRDGSRTSTRSRPFVSGPRQGGPVGRAEAARPGSAASRAATAPTPTCPTSSACAWSSGSRARSRSSPRSCTGS